MYLTKGLKHLRTLCVELNILAGMKILNSIKLENNNYNIIVVGFFQAMWNLKANANTWKMHEKKEKQTDEWSVLFYSCLRVLNTHIPFLEWHARKKKQTRILSNQLSISQKYSALTLPLFTKLFIILKV